MYSDPEKNYGKGYFVHVGVNEDKALERAIESGNKHDEVILALVSRYIWVDEIHGSQNREIFLDQAQRLKQFTAIPMGMINEKKPFSEENLRFGHEYGVELHGISVKRGVDIGENDSCKAVLEETGED